MSQDRDVHSSMDKKTLQLIIVLIQTWKKQRQGGKRRAKGGYAYTGEIKSEKISPVRLPSNYWEDR